MKVIEMLKLARPARKGGGDRYEAPERENLVIYVPQDISRPSGSPLESLKVTFEG